MSPTTQRRLLGRRKQQKGLHGVIINTKLLVSWKGGIVIELNKVLAGGVTSKVGGASSCRSGTPIVWEGPWGPNMESIWWTQTGERPGADSALHMTQRRREGGDKKKGCTGQQDYECPLQSCTDSATEILTTVAKGDPRLVAGGCDRAKMAKVREEAPQQKERAVAPAGMSELPIERKKGPEDEVDVPSSSGASRDKSWSGMRRPPEGNPHASGCEGSEPDTLRAGHGRRDPANGGGGGGNDSGKGGGKLGLAVGAINYVNWWAEGQRNVFRDDCRRGLARATDVLGWDQGPAPPYAGQASGVRGKGLRGEGWRAKPPRRSD